MQQSTILGCGRQWRPCWAGCRGTRHNRRWHATLPMRLGGLGLRTATRMAPAAFWASWADALPMLSQRLPALTDQIMQSLDSVQDGGCLEQLQAAGLSLDRGGFLRRPDWVQLRAGARPPLIPSAEPSEWQQGWQYHASSLLEHHFRETVVNTTPQMTCFRGAKVCTKWLQGKVTINSYSLTTSWNWEQVTR